MAKLTVHKNLQPSGHLALGACLAISFLLLSTTAFAIPNDPSDIAKQIKIQKKEHAELTTKTKKLSSEVSGLKKKLIKTSQVIRKSENKLNGIDKKLKDLKLKKEETLRSLYKEEGKLGGMIGAAQRYQRTSTPQMLIQTSPLDAARASLVLKSTIPKLHDKSLMWKKRLAHLATVEKDISAQRLLQAKEYKTFNSQEIELSQLLEKREKIYEKTDHDRRDHEKKLSKLAAEAKTLEELVLKIKPLSKPTFKRTAKAPPKGMLSPVSGDIQIHYNEKDTLGAKSQGITYAARNGAQIITPLGGKVLFAGPFQKFKQILIVEHQGGYHSLIAGLGQINTVVGATLSAGEPIGTVAKSDNKDRHPVYYELRHNGSPVNPQKLLAKKQG